MRKLRLLIHCLMKKILFTVVIAICFVSQMRAARPSPDLEMGVSAVGGYNPAWGLNAGLDLDGKLSLKDTLDISFAFEGLNDNVWSFGLTARPKVNFRPGTLYADVTAFVRLVARDRLYDFIVAGSAGWKMKHFDFQLGLFSRVSQYLRSPAPEKVLREPTNLLYKLQFNILGDRARWDILGGVKNFTEYEYERMRAPIFYVGGRFDCNDRLGLRAEFDVKPSGILHMTAGFFGVTGRLGATYKF